MKRCPICKDRGDIPKLLKERNLTNHGVEIGVRRADFSEIMLKNWPGIMHLVDPWREGLLEYYDLIGTQQTDYDFTVSRLQPYSGRFRTYPCLSHEAVCQVPNCLDFVYIDANHDYNYVWQDLRLWWDKLHSGGILAGHDFLYWEQLDVTQAVVEFAYINKLTIYVIPGSQDNVCMDGQVPSWYFIKE